ncbi:SDR family oxidoreductase [Liquorilactobacillus mali]|uniref:3-oxoacyl-ACP reductase n=1 Tax=Liquorilactobacillus mali KCTC 3596 = DSM 20444 TaxID=1046596 RepID=J0L7X5_9LACO|nr:SDR family oxidoreductase [Liquorilactobacillus mali]EJF01607.1 3-oxoacyl-ACP reductase [Liquorilactobacillus mali KCTC 3596 = DSM 20444]KRN08756.1 3-oxoacyl-ACP reductase [Liquorilactobacillus mali KCTC 3596 = DSM 20444]QFQ74433.1 SDR family oxidoreductase [Liquorilactobacillus mali]
MDLELNGKSALVLASSKGLGKGTAERLFKEGANVLITSRNEDSLKQVVEEFSEIETPYKNSIDFCVCDLSKVDDINNLITETHKKIGTVDILVNNAGGPKSGRFEDLTDDDWEKYFYLDLLSYIRVTRQLIPDLKENKGHVINILSSSAKQPIPNLILSNVYRLGLLGFSKTLSKELGEYGVLVNAISPGRIATDRVQHLDEVKAENLNKPIDYVQNKSQANIPLGRYGKVEEFANVVAFLASNKSSYMNGSLIVVDGGKTDAF